MSTTEITGIQRDDTVHGETYFTAADMATAAARGFRDGQAAELAAMRAGGEPVGYIITNTLVAGDRAIVFPDKADLAPKIFPRTPVYTHPQPAAQDARQFFDAGWKAAARFCDRDDVVADGIVGEGACPQFEKAFDAAIAAQQGDSHE